MSGYKNTTYTGTADAYEMVYGVYNYDSEYQTTYKEAGQVSNDDFYDNTKTIKYWAAHGRNDGHLWGTSNSTSIDIFNDKADFSWAGGNLEFVFLAVCKQLDGLGYNPRAEYARAMVGSNAVRTVCGYHEAAPSGIDDDIARKFLEYAKQGESVKSSWILANTFYANKGYSCRDYLVLTHSGNPQYSRFEGFPGLTYPRPGADSRTILRFSSTGSNTQPYSSGISLYGMHFNDDVAELQKTIIPTSALIAEPSPQLIGQSAEYSLLSDTDTQSAVIKEIGHTSVTINENEALAYASNWIAENCNGMLPSIASTDNIEISPIIMAEVSFDGGSEEEQVVAYSVMKNNTFNGIPIVGDHCNLVVDDSGAIYVSMKWANYSETQDNLSRLKETLVTFEKAAETVYQYLQASDRFNSIMSGGKNDIHITNVELVYNLDEDSETYQPNWKFAVKGYANVLINCFSGEIIEM